MKRKTPRSTIERSFSFLVLSILTIPLCFAQDCKTQAANKPSALVRGTDDVVSNTGKMNVAEMAKMKPYLAKAESWTNQISGNSLTINPQKAC